MLLQGLPQQKPYVEADQKPHEEDEAVAELTSDFG